MAMLGWDGAVAAVACAGAGAGEAADCEGGAVEARAGGAVPVVGVTTREGVRHGAGAGVAGVGGAVAGAAGVGGAGAGAAGGGAVGLVMAAGVRHGAGVAGDTELRG